MKVVKEITNCIFAFLLCFVFIGTLAVFLLASTLLSKDYMLEQLAQSEYYAKVETDLKNGLEEYQYQSGLPLQVFENLYSSEMIKEDINAIVYHIYDGTELKYHVASVETRLEENVQQYLQENNIVLNSEQYKNVSDFKEIIVNVYESKITFAVNYIEPFVKMIAKVVSLMDVAKIACLAILIILAIFIGIINLKSIGGFLSTIGVSLLATGILFQLLKFVIVKYIDIENILLFSQALSDLIKGVINNILGQSVIFGIWLVVVGIIAIVIGNYYKIKKKFAILQ